MLSRYAATTRADDGSGRADADRAALLLAAVTVAATIAVLAGVLAVPHVLGESVAETSVGSLTGLIVGWGGYVLAVAVAMPYASLGAVRVAQARLLRARFLDTVLQVAAGAALMLFAGPAWLCLPAVAGAVSAAVTLAVLRPLVAGDTGPGTAAGPAAAAVTGAEPMSAG